MNNSCNNSNKKMDSFQFARTLCAIAVFCSYVPCFTFSSGQAGVSIFIIFSAFFAMYSTDKNKNNLFIKKIIKTIPLYWGLTFLVFSVAKIKSTLLNNTDATVNNLVKSIFFIPTYVPNVGHKPIINVGWFLNIDVAFILLFSIINKVNYQKRSIITGIIVFILFLLGRLLAIKNFMFEVYSSFYIIYFCLGLLLYEFYKKYQDFKFEKIPFTSVEIVTIIYFILFMIYFEYNYIFILFSFCFSLIILFYRNSKWNQLVVSIGNISYAFYLIHYFILAICDRLIYNLEEINIFTILAILICFILTIAISKIITIVLQKIEKCIMEKLKLNEKEWI